MQSVINKVILFLIISSVYFIPVLFIESSVTGNNHSSIPNLSEIKTGDFVAIRGHGIFSNQIRKFNLQDNRFSHCGWAVKDGDKIKVYHLMGSGKRDTSRILISPLSNFIGPGNCKSFGIYRFNKPEKIIEQATTQIKRWKRQGIRFDYEFDLTTDSQMYCSELIYKALKNVQNASFMVNLNKVDSKPYISIDQFILNPITKKVYDYAYDQQ